MFAVHGASRSRWLWLAPLVTERLQCRIYGDAEAPLPPRGALLGFGPRCSDWGETHGVSRAAWVLLFIYFFNAKRGFQWGVRNISSERTSLLVT